MLTPCRQLKADPSWILARAEPGSERVLSVEDWAEIRWLRRAEGMPIKQVARVVGVSKNTVKRAPAADGPLRYQRPPRGSVVDAAEPRIRELLAAWLSIRVLRDRVAELRPVYLLPDRASRTAYAAGEVVQCDLCFPTSRCRSGSARPARRPGCR